MRWCANFCWLWLIWLTLSRADEFKIVCVYDNWAINAIGYSRFDPSEIDPHLCTHLIYSEIRVTGNGDVLVSASYDLPDNGGKAGFQEIMKLRKRNEKLKILVRGLGMGNSYKVHSKIAADDALRSKFVKNVVDLVLRHEFEGFHMFWGVVNEDGRDPDNAQNFALLLKELRASFDPHKLILSTEVTADREEAQLYYYIPEASRYSDLIVLNTNFYYNSKLITAHNAPLYPAARETSTSDRICNINASVHYWLDQGAPAKKLILGTRFHGRSYMLKDPAKHVPGSPANVMSGSGLAYGLASYNEICRLTMSKNWTSEWDEEQRVPYSYRGNRWISYDNARSLSEKGEYVRAMGLGGVEARTLAMDDHRGDCGERYPLLNALNRKLRRSDIRPGSTTDAPSSIGVDVGSGVTVADMKLPTAEFAAKIVCYYVSGAIKKIGYGRLDPGEIDAKLCTHLVYVYVSITEDGNVTVANPLVDLPDNGGNAGFQKFNGLRQRNKELKTLVSTGDEKEGIERYWKVASKASLRSKYVKNVVDFLHRHEFNGLELSWIFPTNPEDLPDVVKNFVLFLQDLRSSFDEHNLILGVSLKQFEVYTQRDFDIRKISSYVDFISLNTIYHPIAEKTIGHSEPLYPAAREKTSLDRSLNINATVHYWLEHGAPAEKLIISIKFFGMSFILNNSGEHVPGSPAIVPASYGPVFGYFQYSEICLLTALNGWSTVWDEEQRVPYSYAGTRWITYDNVRSLTEKVEYVESMGLGGLAAWTIDEDDHWGECGERYPLLSTLNRVLKENASSSVATTESSQSTGVNIFCYYLGSTVSAFDYRGLEPSEIDPTLCTHLIYGYVSITEDGEVRVSNPWLDLPDNKGKAGFRKLNALRKRNQKLKTLISSGGNARGWKTYSDVAGDPSLRSKYAKNVVDFVLRHEFDGFDIYWQWPTVYGDDSDVENFVLLLKELRLNFDQRKLILTIQVEGSEKYARRYYDIPQISKYVDFILMGTQCHEPKESVTGHSAPLFPAARETSSTDLTLNINAAVNYWMNQGAPAEKIILSARFFGIIFTLNSSLEHSPGSPTVGGGGSLMGSGHIGYNEICRLLAEGGWSTEWDEEQRVPYIYSGIRWISYDNVRSLIEKGEYAQAMGLGGVMALSLDLDDHKGDCGRRFPLLNALNRGVRGIASRFKVPSSGEIANLMESQSQLPSDDVKIICYYRSSAMSELEYPRLEPSDLDPNLCTHLIYLWVYCGDDGEVLHSNPLLDLPDDGGKAGFQNFNALREKNKNLKTLVASAGGEEGAVKYSRVLADNSLRSKYVKNVVDFVLRHKFDGFDIVWQYPNKDGDSPDDLKNYPLLLKELRENFDRRGLILSVILTGAEVAARKYYDIPEISKYVDFITLDIECHTLDESQVGHLSPLLPAARETSAYARSLNYHAAVHYWLDQGVPPEKLILGLTMYGISYPLNDPAEHEPGSLTSDYAMFNSGAGKRKYNEICELISQDGWTTVWDEEQRMPYSYIGNRWVSYDNARSFTEKAKYVQAMGLGGVMAWSVDTDDHGGKCGERYPLLKVLNRVLRESGSGSRVDTTADEEAKRTCTKLRIKYVRHPQNCAKFWICLKINETASHAEPFSCGKGLYFDTSKTACLSKDLVDCS